MRPPYVLKDQVDCRRKRPQTRARDVLINVLPFTWLSVVWVGLVSVPFAAGASIRNLPAEGITDNSGTTKAELTSASPEAVALTACSATCD
jgi:hypothetical protein